jgi:KaiC/GvpD/RAD55 family RecA-like ATPase
VLETFINPKHIRRFLFHFFSELNDLHTTNWIVMESYDLTGESTAILPYHFLSDGIISLGMSETLDDVVRYLEVIKMRGVCHSLKKFQVSFRKGEFKILGAIYES